MFAVCASGDQPGLDFYNSLDGSGKAKLMALFKRLGDTGRIDHREKFKKLDGELWEFKSHQIRMPCAFRHPRLVVVTHGFIKKTGRIPPAEIARAERILNEDTVCDEKRRR